MATTKVVLELDVQGEELQQLNAELQKTEQNFKDVRKEADKTSKSVDDVASNGGAIAILDQLTGGLATRLRDAYEASKLFNTSLRATRGAIIATGIGAFVVVLGTVVAYWDQIQELVTGVNTDLREQKALLEENISTLSTELEILDAQQKLREAQGESLDDILERRKNLLESLILENQLRLANIITERQALAETIADRQRLAGILTFTNLGGILGPTGQQTDQFKQLQDEATEAEKTILSLSAQLAVLNRQINGEDIDPAKEPGGRAKTRSVSENFGDTSPFAKLMQGRIDAEQDATNQIIDIRRFEADQKDLIDRESAENYAKIQEARREAEVAMTASALGAISQLVGEQTALGKGLAIAQATIDTFAGANKAIAQGGFLGIATATAVIAAGLANVQRIVSTQVPNVPGVNVSGGSGQAPQLPQANFNVVGDAGINSVAEAVGRQTNEPVRAYVVTQDINTAQDLERSTIESSTV